jgi:hypothetical protein
MFDHFQMQKQAALNPIQIPSSAADWFDLDEIHEVEKDSLPEFFNGRYPSKTPQTYKEYRNLMVLLYRQNPNAYLTSTSEFIIS